MSDQIIKIIIAGALLLQGLSHGKAFLALLTDASRSEGQPPVPVRSWLMPSLSIRNAAIIASLFWLLATLGFIAAALVFWGIFLPGETWRQLAIASSVVSSLGIIIFSGIWPGAPNRKLARTDTVIALVINAAILVLLLWFGWPPESMFGN